ncbi:GNAT family N-acetyltransferase [Massilia sp. ST3]|uniref:GNAT family N-acetyltransferase n=1 Tax=Massilia sp. ST3 TaxID=2824903 RepID=UPI001B81CEB0|nr:GNAT family N-acetyltransferase [Massilia sp. ST3]MBQ5947215.1 GNAT family N-acetyltransferase [Massilia sp. ST3]
MMEVLRTERLRLRTLREEDADFYLELVNDPAFIEHIGDRGLRTVEDARRALREGPLAMHALRGHSLYLVERLEDGAPVGLSGLIKRDSLDDVDIGYAFLPRYRGLGYALEAGHGVVRHARALGIPRLVAITTPGNAASIGLLLKLGLRFERQASLAPSEPPVNVYLADLAALER